MRGSIIRIGNLRKVFKSDLATDFDAHLAQLSVLYEDLRIETLSMYYGARVAEIDAVESTDEDPTQISKYRRHYFLRRSFATVREFAECFKDLRKTPEFISIRSAANAVNAKTLDDALLFFSTNTQLIQTVRNNSGGHFGIKSARYAVNALEPTAVSRIEMVIDERKVNAKLHYAGELVATAFSRGVKGKTSSERITEAISTVAEAYGHANSIARVMLAEYLIDRFGK